MKNIVAGQIIYWVMHRPLNTTKLSLKEHTKYSLELQKVLFKISLYGLIIC